jgi:hypothetical protein
MRPAKLLMAPLVAIGVFGYAAAGQAKPLQLSEAQMDGVTAGTWFQFPHIPFPCVYVPPPPLPCPPGAPPNGFRITVVVTR